ncbi:histamine N-methyltransferase-like [Glandiceps talaboti]
MQEVEKLISNDEEYIQDLDIFLRNMRVPKNDNVDDEIFMKGVFKDPSFRPEKEIRILSIGSGSGDIDKFIINALTAIHPKIICSVVEPMKVAVANYKEMVTSHKAEWSGVEFKYYIQTIEKYLDDNQDDHSRRCEHYDVIHAIHCVYYFEKRDGTFRDLYSRLHKNGVMLIRISGGGFAKSKVYINRIRKLAYTGVADMEEILLKEIPSDATEIKTTKADVIVTECFNEDSDEGNQLLDFITQISKFRKSMPQEIVQMYMKYLKSECVEKEGRNYLLGNHQGLTNIPLSCFLAVQAEQCALTCEMSPHGPESARRTELCDVNIGSVDHKGNDFTTDFNISKSV